MLLISNTPHLIYWSALWLRSGKSLKEVCVAVASRSNGEIADDFKNILKMHFVGVDLAEALENMFHRQANARLKMVYSLLSEAARCNWGSRFTAKSLAELQYLPEFQMQTAEPAAAEKPENERELDEIAANQKARPLDHERPLLTPDFLIEDAILWKLGVIIYGHDEKLFAPLQTRLEEGGTQVTAVLAQTSHTACAEVFGNLKLKNPEIGEARMAEVFLDQHVLLIEVASQPGKESLLMKVIEICGYAEKGFQLQTLLELKREGIDRSGRVIGKYFGGGFVPDYVSRLELKGDRVSRGIYFELQQVNHA